MDDRFKKLKELLDEQNYPSVYMFKFIIKQDKEKMVEIKRCFEETAEFEVHESRNGNYISVSIKQMMLSSEDIINKYIQVGKIENVIPL